MGKIWVLDTETKGTGAEMVPLEKIQRRPEADPIEGTWADPGELFDVGDRIIVLGRMRGRARATGRSFEIPFPHVWGLTDGVPSRCRAYLDTAPVSTAIEGPSMASKD